MGNDSLCPPLTEEVLTRRFMVIAGQEVERVLRISRHVDETLTWNAATDVVMSIVPKVMKDDISMLFARWRIRRRLGQLRCRGSLDYQPLGEELTRNVYLTDDSCGDVDVMDILRRVLTPEDIGFLLDDRSLGARDEPHEKTRLHRIRKKLIEALSR